MSIRILRAIALLSFVTSPLAAQTGIHVSNEDPRWGETITIGYIAPADSPFAKGGNTDTLYCAANVRGVRPERALILPMRHLSGATYEAALTVPDSTYTLWVEICTPKNRVPNGISVFSCRTASGIPTPGAIFDATDNVDSALSADMVLYPHHYQSYPKAYTRARELEREGKLKRTDTAWHAWALSLAEGLQKHADNSPAYFLSLAAVYRVLHGRDSLARLALTQAARTTTFDPIFNDVDFWNGFFAPIMEKGGKGLRFEQEPGRILTPLVLRYPRTVMTREWIRHEAFDTLLSRSSWTTLTLVWKDSKDVDLLESVGRGFGYAKGPVFDPQQSLEWISKAELSNRSGAGFFAGENIWGSMGRLPGILTLKIQALADLGRIDEAATVAQTAMLVAKQQYEKQSVQSAIAKAYLDAGRLEDAKGAYGMALALSTRGTVDGLDKLYEKAKQGNETEKEFANRLVETYGSAAKMSPLPDFSYTTIDGVKGTLSGLHGKVVVLDCWFTTCGGCIIEKESLNKLVESYAGDTNIVFLSIALDGPETLHRYFEHTPVKFKVVPNGNDICEKIGVEGYPTHIIIGKDGTTLGNEMGGSANEGEMMRPKIEQALAAK
jgi:thiol-disulfide isomerase/thioredoxin